MTVIGVIGGSGVYDLDGLEDARWETIDSPFGAPSDQLLHGTLEGVEYRFLPRHGRGHRTPPSAIDFRANIDAMKRAGVTDLVSVSACGSLREELTPGAFVLVDQFIDRTFARTKTFFDDGVAAHVALADPTCNRLHDALVEAGATTGIELVRGGTYLAMEGPQFSTRAESHLYRSWGCDVIGMTNMPEAKLAREAELCYATVAMVTDYDCWHPHEADVDVADIVAVLTDNADRGRSLVAGLAPILQDRPVPCAAGCDRALDGAILTAPGAADPAALARLDAVAGRVLGR
ncbi:MAG: S-methyl-5'-thioadenosine phosphorylase [Acidimicrobiia bacterium]|nr:S-methyl-5'-thioadenosine phosphorylase [Acidimicrobiia bacterium]